MATFDPNDKQRFSRLDWEILAHGASRIYWGKQALEDASQWFLDHQYHLYRFDCSNWTSKYHFHEAMIHTFHLPNYLQIDP